MERICLHYGEVLELPYTDSFVGIIDIRDSEHGLRGDVIIESTKSDDKLVLGTCVSRDGTLFEVRDYCEKLLRNEEYCRECFSHICEI